MKKKKVKMIKLKVGHWYGDCKTTAEVIARCFEISPTLRKVWNSVKVK